MKNYLLVLLSISILSVSCYKDTDDTPPSQVIIETAEVFVNTSISGSVVDLEGNFLTSYDLVVNNQMNEIPSDYFLLELENLKKKGQTIHVFKEDKQIGIRTQLLVENDINHMEILQHPPYENKIITENDQKLDLNKTIEVDFSNTKWFNGYDDDINVEYVHIDNSNSLTPVGYTQLSDLIAVDSKGGFYLKTYNSNNDPLKAQASHPILLNTSNLEENVNSLFLFDEEDEVWVLVSDIIVGEDVGILGEGYYTFANYSPGVFVEGIVTKESKAVAYQPMEWELSSLSNQIYATEKGKWIALLPENESVEVVLLNPCKESLQTETLDIKVNDIANQNLMIQDSKNYQLLDVAVVGCEGELITQPNFNISSNKSSYYYTFSEDYADRWIAVCDEFDISTGDKLGDGLGPELEWSTAIDGSMDILTSCSDFELGFTYITIEDESEIYPAFKIERDGDRTTLKSEEEHIKFIFKGDDVGMYEVDEVNVFINDSEFGTKGIYVKCENSTEGCGIDNFNVTHFATPEKGRTMRVSFSGTMWMQILSPSVAGYFDIESLIEIKL